MSRSPQDLFDRVTELTELYLLDELDDAQLAELEAMVRRDTNAASAMRTVLKQAGTMRVVFGEQRNFASRIGEVNRNEYLALLQTLSPVEEPEPVHLVGSLNTKPPLWQQWQFVIPSAIAALLAIAVTLTIALSGSTDAPPSFADNPAAMTQSTPRGSDPSQTPTVATITAEHDAVWSSPQAEGALAPGSALRVGTRLTLTQGFAEITTNRGAIAILEAPATIELIDNDNAIRLHAGKLVGICETESSKGFLVRTPHMNITDLGTRFGVHVVGNEKTETHVMQGSVQVKRSSKQAESDIFEQLVAGEGIVASGQTAGLIRIRAQASVFIDEMPRRFLPAGTGFGLAMDEIDPSWRIVAFDGKPLAQPREMKVVYPEFSDPSSSCWLLAPRDLKPKREGDRTITCKTILRIPESIDLRQSDLFIAFNADFSVSAIRVNGSAVDVPENELDRKGPLTEVAIHRVARPGENTIEIDVFDIDEHTALRAEFELRP